jgi:hypothetical protein
MVPVQLALFSFTDLVIVFYVCLCIVSMYSLVVGIFVEADIQPTSPFAPLLYDLCGGTLYLPLVSQLLVLCISEEDSGRAAVCFIVSIAYRYCTLRSEALPLLVILQMVMMYSTTAVYVGVYRGDEGNAGKCDINFAPRCGSETTL